MSGNQPRPDVRVPLLVLAGLFLLVGAVGVLFILNRTGKSAGTLPDDDTRSDDVVVRLGKVEFDTPTCMAEQGEYGGPEKPCLVAWLEVSNTSPTILCRFSNWQAGYGSAALYDDVGNLYHLVPFPEDCRLMRQGEKGSLYFDPAQTNIQPGYRITVGVVFEHPVTAASQFTLHLSKSNVGGRGNFVLHFNRSFISKRP